MTSKKISIYMPVYNGANYIQCAIESILRQTYKDLSLIISDNCSTDETVSIISKYLSDERVTLFKQPYNVGMLKNGNAVFDRVKTEYFMIICHDDYFYDNNALETGIKILEENKNIPAVYSNMMFVDQHGKPIMQRKFKYSGLISGNTVGKESIISCRNLYSLPLLIRTSSTQGYKFIEEYSLTGDVDFSMFISKGKQIYYIPKPLIALRFHGANNTARDYSRFIEQFKRIAIKHDIKLSKSEQLQMNINNLITVFKKHLFYFYLDNIRR